MVVMVKDTPIILGAWAIPKLLDGSKTQTRRTQGLEKVNKNPDDWELSMQNEQGLWVFARKPSLIEHIVIKCPYGQVGDRLWVRERHRIACVEVNGDVEYRLYYQDGLHNKITYAQAHTIKNWASNRPSIFMHRWASRIPLEITGIRAERLQMITPQDVWDEGCITQNLTILPFIDLWDSLNAKRGYPWEANHWVWPISFRGL